MNFINFYGIKEFTNHKGELVTRRITLSGQYVNNPLTGELSSINVGMSACGNKDKFKKSVGRAIAQGRSINPNTRLINLPIVNNGESPNTQFNNWCSNYCESDLVEIVL